MSKEIKELSEKVSELTSAVKNIQINLTNLDNNAKKLENNITNLDKNFELLRDTFIKSMSIIDGNFILLQSKSDKLSKVLNELDAKVDLLHNKTNIKIDKTEKTIIQKSNEIQEELVKIRETLPYDEIYNNLDIIKNKK